MTEVRPPIQSCMRKRRIQLSATECASSLLPTPVMAMACLAKSRPRLANASCASSMPLRVSGVPPDFEMTMARVVGSFAAIDSMVLSMPAGSELSKKLMDILDPARASATSCGPRALPPMPMMSRWSKADPLGAAISPRWIFAAKACTSAISSRIVTPRAPGASAELRSQ